jgi:hypothetical protein
MNGLIKWFGLGLTYIVLHSYFNTTRTQQATFRAVNFLHNPQIRHKSNTKLAD